MAFGSVFESIWVGNTKIPLDIAQKYIIYSYTSALGSHH